MPLCSGSRDWRGRGRTGKNPSFCVWEPGTSNQCGGGKTYGHFLYSLTLSLRKEISEQRVVEESMLFFFFFF